MSQRSGQWTGHSQRRQRLSDVTVNMIVTRPIDAIDATIYTSAKVVEDTSAALGALPSLARTLEQLRPGGVLLEEIVKLKRTLDRIDRIGTFVAEELPETQQQLEALNSQLNDSVNRIGELARAILTQTAVNNALNDSIRLLSKGLGVAQGTAETLGKALGRARTPKDET
ncbi:hypothetical protein [Haloechinothrix halophila]|uniref:hypothetical protein n=1 Tax=Haloechinothrix halophila TaxID=1069073 RepID=UPI0004020029|nr:hypothetical protein [Haloechinothrix halophila]